MVKGAQLERWVAKLWQGSWPVVPGFGYMPGPATRALRDAGVSLVVRGIELVPLSRMRGER